MSEAALLGLPFPKSRLQRWKAHGRGGVWLGIWGGGGEAIGWIALVARSDSSGVKTGGLPEPHWFIICTPSQVCKLALISSHPVPTNLPTSCATCTPPHPAIGTTLQACMCCCLPPLSSPPPTPAPHPTLPLAADAVHASAGSEVEALPHSYANFLTPHWLETHLLCQPPHPTAALAADATTLPPTVHASAGSEVEARAMGALRAVCEMHCSDTATPELRPDGMGKLFDLEQWVGARVNVPPAPYACLALHARQACQQKV